MIDFGLSGWMADFGECLFKDVVLKNGDPMLLHNKWPSIWAHINREEIKEAGKQDDITFFMRAGYTGSQRSSAMMWAGDQNVDWSLDDGLASMIPAALSLTLCGCSLHHSDIGGCTTLYGMKRTKKQGTCWWHRYSSKGEPCGRRNSRKTNGSTSGRGAGSKAEPHAWMCPS